MSPTPSTPASVPRLHKIEPISQRGVLPGLDEFLKDNPEPEPYRQEPKKATEGHAVVPVTFDPEDKVNWVGKLHRECKSQC